MKLKFNLQNFRDWRFRLKISLIAIIILGAIASVLFIQRNQVKAPVTEIQKPTEISSVPVTPPEDVKKAISKAPPKTKTSGSTSVKTSSDGSKTVSTSTGPTSAADTSIAAAAGPSGSIAGINYIDQTGTHPELGDILKNYMSSNLLVGSEVNYMYSIILKNAGGTGWAGLYSGYYSQSPTGQITSAWGYITLNSYYYEGNPYFNDYMKLILSHEYGHHYSLYYKWLVWQLGSGTRFPDSYYTVRPLSKDTTAPDYTLGWENCDCEIAAEDYSYLFSGYGVHQMASIYGYPSAATATWFRNEPNGLTSTSSEPSAPSTPDSTPPTVSVVSPSNGQTVSGSVTFSASASDNIGVSKVEFYIDSTKISEDSASPYNTLFTSSNYSNGSHTLKAKAYDAAGNSAEALIAVTINNTVADSTNPTVSITDPADDPHSWSSGTLHIGVTASDNVAIQKIEIYINDQLALTQYTSSVSATWHYGNAPAGTYILKAKAYDTSNNTAEDSTTINKS